MKRNEDKYDSAKAMSIAEALYQRNTQEVMKLAGEAAVNILEEAYRNGYSQALADFAIEVYPKNITTRETIEIEE